MWLAGLLALCYFFDNPKYYQTQMNLFVALILDVIFVASIKAATRRRRPMVSTDLLAIGPDKFR